MAFEIKDPPEFTLDIEQWNKKTKANGEKMALVIEKLLNNDVFTKALIEYLDGNALLEGDKGIPGGVASLGSNGKLAQHVEYSQVDNVPAPEWQNITGKPSYYPPAGHSHSKSEVGLGNVDNTADANKSVKYASSAGDADTLDGKHAAAFASSSHTHAVAARNAPGLMSADDKKKLDGIAASANNYSHPTGNGNNHIPSGGSSGQILRWSAAGTAAWGADNNTTYSAATQSANGLMSAADKKKLDGVAAGANVTPSGLSSGYVKTGAKAGTYVGTCATAEGEGTTSSTYSSHAEGYNTIASGNGAHAEGNTTVASGNYSHAEGAETTASGSDAHAEGYKTTASGNYSHAEGSNTTASGWYSHAGGNGTIASGESQTAIGKYNVEATAANGLFIIGNGSSSARSNAFRVTTAGATYAKGNYNASGADYAEYFEWADGNPDNEDRRGYFVSMEGDKIRLANPDDDYILGVISGKPSVIGNSDPDDWHDHFLHDEFGEFIMEKVKQKRVEPYIQEVEEIYIDGEGIEVVRVVPRMLEREVTEEVDSYIVNPDYDPDKEYTPRADRPEWAAVGMLGVLVVRDDGTCLVNGYCKVADGGTATASESGWRVIKRISDNLVKIVFK